jgi:hypothetical protein
LFRKWWRRERESETYQQSLYRTSPQHSSCRSQLPFVCPSRPLPLDPRRRLHRTDRRPRLWQHERLRPQQFLPSESLFSSEEQRWRLELDVSLVRIRSPPSHSKRIERTKRNESVKICGVWTVWVVWLKERMTHDRAIVVFVLASPFVRFLEWLGSNDGTRRSLRRGLTIRSVPIRHNRTDREDEQRERKRKREWMEIRSKLSISSVPRPPQVATINGGCRTPADPATGHGFCDKRSVTQARFTSRQGPWIHSERVISCCDVLVVWEARGSVERHGG